MIYEVLNDSPHPQRSVSFGLLKTNVEEIECVWQTFGKQSFQPAASQVLP